MVRARQAAAMAEVRNNWEGRIINGVFPLRRFLGASEHSSVFLTESRTEGFLNAAIKLVPADPATSEVQLWHWKTAATFSHPHLMRLLDCGQCELEGRPFLFVVMEHAEETLSQILPYRALSPEEVRELLVPTLDALAFLHRESWVQGQLKPSNFLVVEDQLKLATDTIRPIALARAGSTRLSIYDPPESQTGADSPAGDIWALGVTLVEALTQYPPTWPGRRSEVPALPPNFPQAFADTVQRCLGRTPDDRPTVAELQARTSPTAPALAGEPATPVKERATVPAPQPQAALRAQPRGFFDSPQEHERGRWVPIAVGLLVVFAAVWGGSRLFHRHAEAGRRPQQTSQARLSAESQGASDAPQPPQAASQPSSAPTVSAPVPPATASVSPVHEEIPKVPLSARETIHGHIKVGVRVRVDGSGRVVRDSLDRPGPSRYFNRLASQAARKWKFAPAEDQLPREWFLRFDFGREGTTVHAVRARSQ